MEYSEHLSAFLDFLRDCKTEYNISETQEKDANEETQDLLHCLELHENNYHEMAKISKAIRKVRQERREAKDRERKLQPIVEWTNSNQKTIHELERLLGAVRAQEANASGRLYTPRTDILLRIFGGEKP